MPNLQKSYKQVATQQQQRHSGLTRSMPNLGGGSPGAGKSHFTAGNSNLGSPGKAATKEGFLQTSHSEGLLPPIDQGQDRMAKTDGFNSRNHVSSDVALPPTTFNEDLAKTTSSFSKTTSNFNSFASPGEMSSTSKLKLAQERLRQFRVEEKERQGELRKVHARFIEASDRQEAFEEELSRLAEAKILYEQQLSQISQRSFGSPGKSKDKDNMLEGQAKSDSASPPQEKGGTNKIAKPNQKPKFNLSSWYDSRWHEYSESLRSIERKTWDASRKQQKYMRDAQKLEKVISQQEEDLVSLSAKIDDTTNEVASLQFEVQEEKNARQEAKSKLPRPRPLKPKGTASPQSTQMPNEIESTSMQQGMPEEDLWEQAENLGISPRKHLAQSLINHYGSAKAAMSHMDYNGSGKVSMSEFQYGLAPLGLPPKRVVRIFDFFDRDQSQDLALREIFGNLAEEDPVEERVHTPGATWVNWHKTMRKSFGRELKKGQPKWIPSRSQLIDDLVQKRDYTQQIQDRKKWMKETITRLRGRGLTDSACRELVAQHLPRGHGPKDSHGVRRLDETDIKQERKKYFEKLQGNVNEIQKIVTDLSTQKFELRGAVRDLWNVTEKLQLAQQSADTLGPAIGSMGGLGLSLKKDDSSKKKKDEAEEANLIKKMSSEFNIPEEEVKAIRKEFRELDADNSGWIEKPEFLTLLQTRQKEPLTEVDIENKWKSVLRYKSKFSEEVHSGKAAIFELITKGDPAKYEKHIAFEHFLVWFFENKHRASVAQLIPT